MTLTEKIIELADNEYPNWCNGGRFERLAGELGFKMSNASRRLREQAAGRRGSKDKFVEFAPTLEVRRNGISVEYRFIPREQRIGTPEVKKLSAQEKEDAMLMGLRAGQPLLQ